MTNLQLLWKYFRRSDDATFDSIGGFVTMTLISRLELNQTACAGGALNQVVEL